MARDSRLYLEDLLQGCAMVQRYAADRDRYEVINDGHALDVVLHNLELIGESAACLPKKYRPEIANDDWTKVLELPYMLGDGHADENDALWAVIRDVIPPLHAALQRVQR